MVKMINLLTRENFKKLTSTSHIKFLGKIGNLNLKFLVHTRETVTISGWVFVSRHTAASEM